MGEIDIQQQLAVSSRLTTNCMLMLSVRLTDCVLCVCNRQYKLYAAVVSKTDRLCACATDSMNCMLLLSVRLTDCVRVQQTVRTVCCCCQ